MVTHANTEMAVTKADVFTHSPLEADLACHAVPHREAPGWPGGTGRERERRARVFTVQALGKNG